MNSLVMEQLKIKELIRKINPDVKVDYEGMLITLKKINPKLSIDNISYKYKRILYLQLISSSISKSCKLLKEMMEEEYQINQINVFEGNILEFCQGYTLTDIKALEQDTFDTYQKFISNLFLKKWNEVESLLESSIQRTPIYIH